MRTALGRYSWSAGVSAVPGGAATPTPARRVPTPPARRSDKGARRTRPPLTAQVVGPLVQHPLHGARGPSARAAPRPPSVARRPSHRPRPLAARSPGSRGISRRCRAAPSRRPVPARGRPAGLTSSASAREGATRPLRLGQEAKALGGPEGRLEPSQSRRRGAGRRQRHRALSPRPAGPGARSRMPSAALTRRFPKSTPGFGGDGGGGAGRAAEALGEIESWAASWGVSLQRGGGKLLRRVWTHSGLLMRPWWGRVPPPDVWGSTWPLRVSPGFRSSIDFKAV